MCKKKKITKEDRDNWDKMMARSSPRQCGGCQALNETLVKLVNSHNKLMETKIYIGKLEERIEKLNQCVCDFAAKCDRLEGQQTDMKWEKDNE